MKRVDVYFLLLATLLLICGAVLGIVMGSREDFQLVPVHAHLNLAGWASLASSVSPIEAIRSSPRPSSPSITSLCQLRHRCCCPSASALPCSATRRGLRSSPRSYGCSAC